MPESDQEVFEHFRSDYPPNDRREIAFLAYARFAQDKYDWVNHELARRGGQPPTEEEVTTWIAALPNSRLAEFHRGAAELFQAAAEEYMKPRIEEERAKAVEQSILLRVEQATSFRRTFLPNLFIGVVASFAFAVIVLVGTAIYRGDPSILALFKEPSTQTQPGTAPATR
jgi:hypothetical protein